MNATRDRDDVADFSSRRREDRVNARLRPVAIVQAPRAQAGNIRQDHRDVRCAPPTAPLPRCAGLHRAPTVASCRRSQASASDSWPRTTMRCAHVMVTTRPSARLMSMRSARSGCLPLTRMRLRTQTTVPRVKLPARVEPGRCVGDLLSRPELDAERVEKSWRVHHSSPLSANDVYASAPVPMMT